MQQVPTCRTGKLSPALLPLRHSCRDAWPGRVIDKLEVAFHTIHTKFGSTIPNKVHIMISHVPEYIALIKLSLGQTSDQLIEAMHQYVNRRFTGSRYTVNNVENDSHGDKLLRGTHHINPYNVLTN